MSRDDKAYLLHMIETARKAATKASGSISSTVATVLVGETAGISVPVIAGPFPGAGPGDGSSAASVLPHAARIKTAKIATSVRTAW